MTFDAPGTGQAHYISTAIGITSPSRPGALWQATIDGGGPVALPNSGGGIHMTSIPIYPGQQLVVTVTGLVQGDETVLSLFGFTGTVQQVMEADIYPHGEAAIAAGTTATPASTPAPSFILRVPITNDTTLHDLVSTANLTSAGYDFPTGATLYLHHLLIIPNPPSNNVGRITDVAGNVVLQCPTGITVPVPLPLSGIPYPEAPAISGGDLTWLYCRNLNNPDTFTYYAVGAIV